MENECYIVEDGKSTKINQDGINGIKINFDNANGNKVLIGSGGRYSNVIITVSGNNNTVIIGEKTSIKSLHILMNGDYANRLLTIGKATYIGGVLIQVLRDTAYVKIGEDCMFSTGVNIINDLGLNITDKNTGMSVYNDKNIIIGNHVWLGRNSYIAGGTVIASDCVIGTKSYVSGNFLRSFCSICGNPAIVKKKNINFLKVPIDNFNESLIEK